MNFEEIMEEEEARLVFDNPKIETSKEIFECGTLKH